MSILKIYFNRQFWPGGLSFFLLYSNDHCRLYKPIFTYFLSRFHVFKSFSIPGTYPGSGSSFSLANNFSLKQNSNIQNILSVYTETEFKYLEHFICSYGNRIHIFRTFYLYGKELNLCDNFKF